MWLELAACSTRRLPLNESWLTSVQGHVPNHPCGFKLHDHNNRLCSFKCMFWYLIMINPVYSEANNRAWIDLYKSANTNILHFARLFHNRQAIKFAAMVPTHQRPLSLLVECNTSMVKYSGSKRCNNCLWVIWGTMKFRLEQWQLADETWLRLIPFT